MEEIWSQYGFPSPQAFYKAYPNAKRSVKKNHNKKKRTRKWTRAIIKHGKIIAAPPNMLGKYQLEGTLWQTEVRREAYWERRYAKQEAE